MKARLHRKEVRMKRSQSDRKRLRAMLPFLQVLKDLSPNQRAIILAHIDEASCETIYETVSNVLKNRSVSDTDARKLRKILAPHKGCLRSLASKRLSSTQKRRKLYTIGGLPLGTILGVGIPLLLNLIRSQLK
jgi:hypothetical protein